MTVDKAPPARLCLRRPHPGSVAPTIPSTFAPHLVPVRRLPTHTKIWCLRARRPPLPALSSLRPHRHHWPLPDPHRRLPTRRRLLAERPTTPVCRVSTSRPRSSNLEATLPLLRHRPLVLPKLPLWPSNLRQSRQHQMRLQLHRSNRCRWPKRRQTQRLRNKKKRSAVSAPCLRRRSWTSCAQW